MNKTAIRATVAVAAASLIALPAASAQAKGGDGAEIRKSGSCTASANWKLKAKHRDGRIEVEFEVDSNRNGQKWNWAMSRNGRQFASGSRTTQPPSGSFSVERVTGNAAGADRIVARAVHPNSGQICRGVLSI